MGTFSKYIIFIINLIFFIGISIILKKILKLYDKEYLTIPLTILYGLSIGAVSTVLFLRMYCILTFFCVLYLYINLLIKKNNFEINRKQKMVLIITTVLGFLTQYYFCIYAIIIFVLMIINMLLDRKYKHIKNYIMYHILSAIIGILLFPSSLYHIFFSYRGIGNTESDVKFITRLRIYFSYLLKSYSIKYIIGLSILIFAILYLIIKLVSQIKYKEFDKNKLFKCLILVIPNVIYLVVISRIAPYKNLRYIMPIIPITGLNFILLLENIIKDIKFFVKMFIIYFIVIISTFTGFFTNKPISIFQGYNKCVDIAKQYKDLDCIHIGDEKYVYTNILPEFMIYNKSMVLNINQNNFDELETDEELQSQDSFILTIKTKINNEEAIVKILKATHFTQVKKLIDAKSDATGDIYLISR